MDLLNKLPPPKPCGTRRIKGRTVEFFHCSDSMMGQIRHFYRADCDGETIATMCATKE